MAGTLRRVLPCLVAFVAAFVFTPRQAVWDGHFFFGDSKAGVVSTFTLSYFQNPGSESRDAYYRPLDRLRMETGFALAGWEGVILPLALLHALGTWGMLKLMGQTPAACWLAMAYALHPVLSEPLHYLPGNSDLILAVMLVWILLWSREGSHSWALALSLVAPWVKESGWVLPLVALAAHPSRLWVRFIPVILVGGLWIFLRPDDIKSLRHLSNPGALMEGAGTALTLLPQALLTLCGASPEVRGHYLPLVHGAWSLGWLGLIPLVIRSRGYARGAVLCLALALIMHVPALVEDASGQLWLPWSSRLLALAVPLFLLALHERVIASKGRFLGLVLPLWVALLAIMHAVHAAPWSSDVALWRAMTREPVGVPLNWQNAVGAELKAGNIDQARIVARKAWDLGVRGSVVGQVLGSPR